MFNLRMCAFGTGNGEYYTVLKTKALYKWHMSNMVGFIRLNLFVKIDLFEWLNHPFLQDKSPPGQIQLDLFWERLMGSFYGFKTFTS